MTSNPYALRRAGLRKNCRKKNVGGFVAFDASDVYYLSGFSCEGCFMLVGGPMDYLFAPPLLALQARASVGKAAGLSVVSDRALLKCLNKALEKDRIKALGYDPSKVPVSLYKELSSFRGVSLAGLDGFVLKQRMIKDQTEINLISEACRITHEAVRELTDNLREGQNEAELSKVLEGIFFRKGVLKPAFDTIVAFGGNTAFPHHEVGGNTLKKDSVVVVDAGCRVQGYRSDLTRTVFFGKISSDFRKIYGIVRRSQELGIDAIRDGVSSGRIDSICRSVIEKAGYGAFFVHGTGHGVGIDIHEMPRLGIKSKEILREGMVVTVEPGIYLPGKFGVRIEDTVLVTKSGCRVLTKG